MEKRAILAFVLSFVVLLIWMQYSARRPVDPVGSNNINNEEQIDKSVEKAVPDHQADQSTSPVQSEIKAGTPDVEEKVITVETPLYIATFSNSGPSLTGLKLKKYRSTLDPDSPPVELFTAQDHVKDHISLYFDDPLLKDAKNLVFKTGGESIVLSQGESDKEISFRFVASTGIAIEQIFSFSAESYDIGLKIKIANQSANAVNGNIKAVINNLKPAQKSRYYTFIGASVYSDNELNEFDFDDLEENQELSGSIEWVAYENEYFISAVIPHEKKDVKFTGTLQASGVATATHISSPLEITPGAEVSKEYSLFLGPRD
ncbi:MAG: membrane protein insertase YidC, partial [Deltaproteobacteria bacterium]|nr:membrane protein insertase YidC [Deltaproteobacteria bacterium]